MPASAFEPNRGRRRRIPRRRHRVTDRPAYDAGLRQRGGLTVWSSDEAIHARAAEPRRTRGGQPWHPPLATPTALTSRAVFRLAHRRAEGPIGSIVGPLGPAPRAPDHTTSSRHAATLEVAQPPRPGAGVGAAAPVHPPLDSTGLRPCGAVGWLTEEHGTRTRRPWKEPHLGVDAGTGRIVASAPTGREGDDGARAGPSLDRVADPVASFTGEGGCDRKRVRGSVAERRLDAAVIVPPRMAAVPGATAESTPTRRDCPLWYGAERGRMGWRKAPGCTKRARVEAAVARWKRVIGDGLRSRADERRATEAAVAAHAPDRGLDLGRPSYDRTA